MNNIAQKLSDRFKNAVKETITILEKFQKICQNKNPKISEYLKKMTDNLKLIQTKVQQEGLVDPDTIKAVINFIHYEIIEKKSQQFVDRKLEQILREKGGVTPSNIYLLSFNLESCDKTLFKQLITIYNKEFVFLYNNYEKTLKTLDHVLKTKTASEGYTILLEELNDISENIHDVLEVESISDSEKQILESIITEIKKFNKNTTHNKRLSILVKIKDLLKSLEKSKNSTVNTIVKRLENVIKPFLPILILYSKREAKYASAITIIAMLAMYYQLYDTAKQQKPDIKLYDIFNVFRYSSKTKEGKLAVYSMYALIGGSIFALTRMFADYKKIKKIEKLAKHIQKLAK